MLFFACENKIEEINKFKPGKDQPLEFAKDIHIRYTEKGMKQALIFGRTLNRYETEKEQIIKITDSLEVRFYDSTENLQSILTAQNGTFYQNKGIMHVRENVVFKNLESDQTLYTEDLTWNQDSSSIYTPKDEYVRVVEKDNILKGYGLVADQNFNSYEISNLIGSFSINK